MYFPTQKLFYFIVPVVVVLILFGVIRERQSSTQVASINQAPTVELREELPRPDSDSDGFEDWVELIDGTDPYNADSNASNETSLKAKDAQENFEYETATEKLGVELFSEYIALKQSGGINPVKTELLVSRLTSELEPAPSLAFGRSDLFITEDSIENLRVYGNQVGFIINKYRSNYASNPTLAAGDFLSESSTELTKKASATGQLYEDMATELIGVSVPSSIAETHLELVNTYLASASALNGFSLVGNDPVVSLLSIQVHSDAAATEEGLLQYLSLIFNQNGIIFEANEPGAFW